MPLLCLPYQGCACPTREVPAPAPDDQAWPERFIEEIRRREKVVRIFPNIGSVKRLVGALCAETHEEWSTGRRYLKMEEFLEWQAKQQTGKPDSEELPEPAAAVA
ncbi:hypothetical protein GGP85_000114 [Salinibacter ruber]|nr:hypothetical protein [Salinibacter ruber]